MAKMNNSCPLNIKFNFLPILKKALESTLNVNLRQFSLFNILYFIFYVSQSMYLILILIATIHLFEVSCFLFPLAVSWQVLQQLNLFFHKLPGVWTNESFFRRSIFVIYYIVVLFVSQALVFLFLNNSVSECGKKKPLVLKVY